MQIEREVKENALHAIENQRKVGVTILKSGRIGFKTKYVKRDEERHCIMINGSVGNSQMKSEKKI